METTVEQTQFVAEMPQPRRRTPKAKRASTARRARTAIRVLTAKAKSRGRRPTMGTSKPRVAKLRRPPGMKRRRR